MPAETAALTVNAARERGYLAGRQGLHPAAAPATLAELASAHAGLHAARLPTPYVTLRSRLPDFDPKELRNALSPGGGLVKIRTVRRTLHIYPVAEAAAAHTATLRLRLAATAATVRRLGRQPQVLARIAPAVRAALADGPLGHRQLEQRVLEQPLPIRARRDQHLQLARLAIKWLWESGELAYRNTADSLHRERREFALTSLAHPDLRLDDVDEAGAVALLLRRYLSAFGPASIVDFRWWSGLTQTAITRAVELLRPDLVNVRVDGIPDSLLLLAEDERGLRTAEPLPADHVALLAYEDPALKGYFGTRSRYVDDRYRTALFNTIGEARANITAAARCVGVWRFDRHSRTTFVDTFAPLPPAQQRALVEQVDRMTEFLRSEPS
ncbi:DNA glycosylase AlkZ-like family protein [Cryptosporangium phraense]|uniref:DNA glycosylase AlkZ-like family protein n=1 Tax=Cryptosporangium phraense TaxID=2593070 RepID=UPI001478B4EA|nr:crosslink repair DNA glycosylase YcaQ family protein [Cryptosporangium phraense]